MTCFEYSYHTSKQTIKYSDNFRIVFKWQECDNFILFNFIEFGNLILCFRTKLNYYKMRNYIFRCRENRHVSILNNAKADFKDELRAVR